MCLEVLERAEWRDACVNEYPSLSLAVVCLAVWMNGHFWMWMDNHLDMRMSDALDLWIVAECLDVTVSVTCLVVGMSLSLAVWTRVYLAV